MSSAIPSTQSLYNVVKGKGSIEGALTLRKDAPVPQPKRGQVLIRVRAVSLNYRDLLICKGGYPAPTKDGVVPASDGAGEIVALGEDAASASSTGGDWKVGDRVAAIFTPAYLGGTPRYSKGLVGSLGGDIDGMLAQYVALDATALVRVPDYMSLEEAATLPCAGVTAYNSLFECVNPLRANHVVLVLGTGGVSVLAAQIAIAAGARVIATSSSDEKLQRMKQLGVAEGDLINYKTTPEWGAKVRELTGGVGVDHVLEVGGAGTIAQSVAATRRGGEVSVIGFVGGVKGEGLNPLSVLSGALSVRGINVGSREHFLNLLDHFAVTKVKAVVDRTFPLDKAVDAYKYVEAGSHFGKVVITL